MTFIIYGWQKTSIGLFEPPNYQCPNCEELNTTYIVVYSFYYHIFWMPFFPYKKEPIANCSACGFVRDEIKFGPTLTKEFNGKLKNYRDPLWTWSITLFIFSLIILLIIL